MNTETLLEKLKSRKLWVTLGICAAATVELHLGKLTSGDWTHIVMVVFAVYGAGQSVVDALTKRVGP
jgi:hypothetical protein